MAIRSLTMKSPIQVVIFPLFIISLCYVIAIAEDSPCGDWEPFKEEKCFKIFDKVGLQTHDDAEKTCQDNKSSLVSILFQEEQDFLTNLIFEKRKIVDNVWVGAKFLNKKFKWGDESEMTFTNWAPGSPKNISDYCVQMHSDVGSVGKWVDEPCKKNYVVVCEKTQNISVSRLHEMVINIMKNPVPIGFIYVQLPNEKSPKDIWPWMMWKDITSNYAGLFFRAEGGEAASFGKVQENNAPRLIEVNTGFRGQIDKENPSSKRFNNTLPIGSWSDWIWTGTDGGSDSTSFFHRYKVSGGEVRPQNMAIRVWKRAG